MTPRVTVIGGLTTPEFIARLGDVRNALDALAIHEAPHVVGLNAYGRAYLVGLLNLAEGSLSHILAHLSCVQRGGPTHAQHRTPCGPSCHRDLPDFARDVLADESEREVQP